MKKKLLSIVSVAIVLAITFSCVSAPAYAASSANEMSAAAKYKLGKGIVKAFGAIADPVINGVAALFPKIDWPTESKFVSENFYNGTGEFKTAPAENAHWRAGYASASVIPEDLAERGYVRAGEFHLKEEKTYKVIEGDDQCFRAVALSDSSGSGTVLFCSLDAFGISSTNVRKLRGLIAEEAKKAGITDIASINLTVSHVHSALDTHGLGASIFDLIKESIKAGVMKLVGKDYEVSSLDKDFMDSFFDIASETAVKAIKKMSPGSLYFNSFDISDLLYDKQYPLVYDTNVNQIKFVPDNESARGIWLVNMGCHPVRMTGYDYVSSDYPGALVRWADELAHADVAFYQGAQAAITRDESPIKYDKEKYNAITEDAYRTFYIVDLFGKELVTRIMNNAPVDSFSIEPYINIRHAEVKLRVDNSLIKLISKIYMTNNVVVSNTGRLSDVKVVSEIGYCELGSRLAIAVVPGELTPEIAYGGVVGANEAWNGTDWGHDSFKDTVGGRKLITFGLTNDQIGYIVPDNDYAHAFASLFEDLLGGGRYKHYEEMISLGSTTASTLATAFKMLVDSTKEPLI